MTDASDARVQALLRDLGYWAGLAGNSERFWLAYAPNNNPLVRVSDLASEQSAWAACLDHAESEDGKERNFAKVAPMIGHHLRFFDESPAGFGKPSWTASKIGSGVKAKGPTIQDSAWRLLLKTRGIA